MDNFDPGQPKEKYRQSKAFGPISKYLVTRGLVSYFIMKCYRFKCLNINL